MRAGLCWSVLLWLVPSALAQLPSTSETLIISANSAATWSSGDNNVIQLGGSVVITMDRMKLSAQQAVIWLSPAPGGLLQEQDVRIVLIGDADLWASDNHVHRRAPRLLVTAEVRGDIELTAPIRVAKDLSDTPLFQQARAILSGGEGAGAPPAPGGAVLTSVAAHPPPALGGTSAAGLVQPPPSKYGEIVFNSLAAHEVDAPDGTGALEFSGGATVTQLSDNGDFLTLSAQNIILFTSVPAAEMKGAAALGDLGKKITAAYLEGDVVITQTPVAAKKPEQRMSADQVYYDFRTQQAILTAVVMHTLDPQSQIPIIVRAQTMRQLADGEYTVNKVAMTTSQFAVPTFSVRSSYAYIHEDAQTPGTYDFTGRNDTFDVFGAPVFYLPYVAGDVSQDPFPLRNFSVGSSSWLGFGGTSDWGLFETVGRQPPKDLDLDYRLAYYDERGFGGGLGGKYEGGFITDSADPWNFQGDFQSFLMDDRGIDQLGGARTDVTPPSETRGQIEWQHQQFLPDDWQIQVRAGYVSDPTFLQEYYTTDFDNDLPWDAEFYVKHQTDTEALTFLAETDTTSFITNADRQQEQFDVARLPEISYQRIGDSFADDDLTLYSDNSASGLKFDTSSATLAQQGYYPGLSPGLPTDGYTGTTPDIIFRADSRQEVDWPFAVGEFKMVPYVMGRVTTYSNSPGDDGQTRLFGGTGLRMTTTFWNVDDSIESDLFDLHRIRHVIQPEVNLFTSATTVDQSKLYIFDPNVDAVNDISAEQVALHQHWETMRGGPGRWESEDILDADVEGDFYANQPPPNILNPVGFRGIFYPSEPETSVPRQAVNGDLTWHIGDNTAFISDAQWNMDTRELAIAEAGIAVGRGSRLSYYIGDSYVQELESQVFSFSANYDLTDKYTMNIAQALDFGPARDVVTSVTLIRRFDVFAVSLTAYHDGIAHNSGVGVNVYPIGMPGFSSPWGSKD